MPPKKELPPKIRSSAIQLKQRGMAVTTIAVKLGVSRSSVYNWLARHAEQGDLTSRPRSGRRRKVNGTALDEVARFIISNRLPLGSGGERGLWSPERVGEIAERTSGNNFTRWTRTRLLQRLGLVPQRRDFHDWKNDSDPKIQWASRQFQLLKAFAKQIGARICFLDFSPIPLGKPVSTAWVDSGKAPASAISDNETVCNMLSAISPSGGMYFMVIGRHLSARILCEFLDGLIVMDERPVVLIAARHPAILATATTKHVAKRVNLHLYVIPAYDPALNHGTYVWEWRESQVID